MQTKTVDLGRLKDAVGFKLHVRCWGNRAKADMTKVETEADKSRLSLTKRLVDAVEYDAITKYAGALRAWVKDRTVPSYFAEGIYLVNVNAFDTITEKMKKSQGEYKELVDKFIAIYPDKVKAAKGQLIEQFDLDDYPDPNDLRNEFSIENYWVSFSTPENLPAEFKKAEADKLSKKMTDAADCITQALREGFLKLVTKAAEAMTPVAGEKPKKFYDAYVENIVGFIDTFQQRNLTNDLELEKLIAQAKSIIDDPTMKDVRKDIEVRGEIGKKFQALAESMDGMVVEKKKRKFDFSE